MTYKKLLKQKEKTENNYMFDEKTIDTLFGFFEKPEEDEVFHEIVK